VVEVRRLIGEWLRRLEKADFKASALSGSCRPQLSLRLG
jgi:hypothetical protein